MAKKNSKIEEQKAAVTELTTEQMLEQDDVVLGQEVLKPKETDNEPVFEEITDEEFQKPPKGEPQKQNTEKAKPEIVEEQKDPEAFPEVENEETTSEEDENTEGTAAPSEGLSMSDAERQVDNYIKMFNLHFPNMLAPMVTVDIRNVAVFAHENNKTNAYPLIEGIVANNKNAVDSLAISDAEKEVLKPDLAKVLQEAGGVMSPKQSVGMNLFLMGISKALTIKAASDANRQISENLNKMLGSEIIPQKKKKGFFSRLFSFKRKKNSTNEG